MFAANGYSSPMVVYFAFHLSEMCAGGESDFPIKSSRSKGFYLIKIAST